MVDDRYLSTSIKGVECERRAGGHIFERAVCFAAQELPRQWGKYLSSGQNKTSIQKFIVKHWETVTIKMDLTLYIGIGDEGRMLTYTSDTSVVCMPVPELNSDHEEADTRMLLHAQHSHNIQPRSIIIHSPDTDVAVLALYFAPAFSGSEIMFATGVGNRRRILPITAMATHLTPPVTEAPLGPHAISQREPVSAFHGKGKKSNMFNSMICYGVWETLSLLTWSHFP